AFESRRREHIRRAPALLDERAVRHDGDVVALAHGRRATERHGGVGAGIRPARVSLPAEMLRLEKEHRVLASKRGAREASRIPRVRRHDNAKPGRMAEERLGALAMVDRAAPQVATGWDADDDRALEAAVRAPSHEGELAPDLIHRRPDEVEKLDLDDRPRAAHGHADRSPDDRRLGERRIEHAIASEA